MKNVDIYRYSKSYQLKTFKTSQRLRTYINSHNNDVWLSWSGGKDSTASLVSVLDIKPDIPVIFFNSGLEFPENIQYMHNLVNLLSINFHNITPKFTALELLQKSEMWGGSSTNTSEDAHGNDGGGGITNAYFHKTLITEPSHEACERFGAFNITGLRAEESVGRRILLAKNDGCYTKKNERALTNQKSGPLNTLTTLCPIWDWKILDVETFLEERGIPQNPIYAKMEKYKIPKKDQRVGLFFDGNGIEMGRMTYLKNAWPDLWEILKECLPELHNHT